GHQSREERKVISDSTAPSASPAAQAVPTALRRPTRAQASPGTTISVQLTGSSPTGGPPHGPAPAHHGGQHPGRRGQAVGRPAEQDRPALRLGRSLRRQARAGEAGGGPQGRGGGGHSGHQPD